MTSPGSTTSLTPAALVVTSHLLRHDNPTLALTIKLALQELAPPANQTETIDQDPLNAGLLYTLHARTIGEILEALTLLGQTALSERDSNPWRAELLHQLLEEWAGLADWILGKDEAGRLRPY